MSLLMFEHQEQSAVILTDTLATTIDGDPLIFQTKAWVIPHLNMGLATVGVANLGAVWNDFLHASIAARDITMVDQVAPEQLRRIWNELLAEHQQENEQDQPTCTIYHFGFPEGLDRLVRYTYRSAKGFESERREDPCFAMKPQPVAAANAPGDIHDWVRLALQVRAEQDELPHDEKVYIGGELFLLEIQNWQSQVLRVHRFDDYEQAWLAMSARLHQ